MLSVGYRSQHAMPRHRHAGLVGLSIASVEASTKDNYPNYICAANA
jgi:hypothetical protein